MAYSLLIKNGLIANGKGGEPFRGDIAISEGKIKDIGQDLGDSAEKIIEAAGLCVAPGFIDITNHSDAYGTLFFAPMQESMLMQGVTTIVVGNCGQSLAPLITKSAISDLDRWTTGFSVPIDWTSVKDFYKTLEKIGMGLNVATLAGQETLKKDTENIAGAAMLLDSALEEGAWGLSSNFNFSAWTQALESETLAFLKIVTKHNALCKVHMHDEGKDFLPSVATVLRLARLSGAHIVISHLKAVGRGAWKDFNGALKMIQNGEREGLKISFDFFPYMRTGSMLVSLLPAWAKNGTREETLKRVSDKYTREQIIDSLNKMTLHADRIMIASASQNKSVVGKTLKEISENAGISPEELIVELLSINRLNVTVFGRTISQKNLLRASAFPGSIVSSDGAGYNLAFKNFGDLAHPRSFGAYPRFLGLVSKKAGVSLGDAVRKMTALPAEKIGFSDRGLIEKGYAADIVIFTSDFKDKGTYKNPYKYAEGIRYSILGGRLAIEEGKINSSRNGKILIKRKV